MGIQLSPEQIAQGCEVKQVEVSPSTLYPKCCQKFVKCPTANYWDSQPRYGYDDQKLHRNDLNLYTQW